MAVLRVYMVGFKVCFAMVISRMPILISPVITLRVQYGQQIQYNIDLQKKTKKTTTTRRCIYSYRSSIVSRHT